MTNNFSFFFADIDKWLTFGAFGARVRDQPYVAHLAHRGEEVLEVAGTNARRQLHAEHGALVPLLGREFGRAFAGDSPRRRRRGCRTL